MAGTTVNTTYGSKGRGRYRKKASGTVDNVYMKLDDAGDRQELDITGEINAENAQVFTTNSGAANVSALNSALAVSNVYHIAINNPKGGAYPLSGTVTVPLGKSITIKTGCRFSGTATIQGPGVIHCGARDHIFDSTITLTNILAGNGWGNFTPYNWGAKGDDATDDYAGCQAFFNYCTTVGRGCIVYVPSGSFAIGTGMTMLCNANYTPRIVGEQKGHGKLGTTFKWIGAAGGTVLKIQRFQTSSIENIEIVGNVVSGIYPKYLLHLEADGAASYFSYFVRLINCSLGNVAGTDSACLNLNATGAYTNYQCSEVSIEHCTINGNGWGHAQPSWYGIYMGGFNTKNFYIKNCNIQNFFKAAFKTVADAGVIHSSDNLLSLNEWIFDLSNGTHLISIGDYSESSAGLLKTGEAIVESNYNLSCFYWAASNYNNETPGYPITFDYMIQGRGQLTIVGGTFDSGAVRIPKINWSTDDGKSSVVALGNNFANIRQEYTPFYSSGNPVMVQDRENAVGSSIKHRVTSLGNVGMNSAGDTAYRFPDGFTDDFFLRGLVKMSASTVAPTTGRWNINDICINLGGAADARTEPMAWRCVRTGTFKTISVTGNYTLGSNVVTAVSDITQIEVGDYVKPSAGWNPLDYPYSVYSVNTAASSFVISNWNATGAGSATFINFVPIFQSVGVGYGTTANRPTLTVNDIGFLYYDTQIVSFLLWNGTAWVGTSQWANSGANIYFNTGSVGVGTNSPSGVFHVKGGNSNFYISDDGANPKFFMGGSSGTIAGVFARLTAAASFYFGENTEAGGMHIRGKEGLTVNGQSAAAGTITGFIGNDATNASANKARLALGPHSGFSKTNAPAIEAYNISDNAGLTFWTYLSGSLLERMKIDENGNVIIPDLSGTGTRMVTATSTGQLGTDVFPSVGYDETTMHEVTTSADIDYDIKSITVPSFSAGHLIVEYEAISSNGTDYTAGAKIWTFKKTSAGTLTITAAADVGGTPVVEADFSGTGLTAVNVAGFLVVRLNGNTSTHAYKLVIKYHMVTFAA